VQLFHLGAVTEFDLSIQVSFFKSKPNMMTVEKRNIIEVLGHYLGFISIQAKKNVKYTLLLCTRPGRIAARGVVVLHL